MVKPIRDAESYDAAVRRLEKLAGAKSNSPAGDEAAVLATLIKDYEKRSDDIFKPTAIEAIKFRMEQLGLKPRDLIPDIGSKSRVSEVLSGQRPLTVDMIKSLHERWEIPLAALINVNAADKATRPEPSKPIMKKLRALNLIGPNETYNVFRERICHTSIPYDPQAAYRRRITATADVVALDVWCVGAIAKSLERCPRKSITGTSELGDVFLREVARCSARPNGPIAARELLSEVGICFVVLPHFPGTHLDGAAMVRQDGLPVVALTLRHDRIDNFWFTLLHECSHIILQHVGDEPILDDLEISSSEAIEDEADKSALKALVPRSLWKQLNANEFTSTAEIVDVAHEAGVHPAIVAGMWRKDQNNYRKFSALLGHGTVRKLFEADFES